MAIIALALTWLGGAAFRVLVAIIGAAIFFEWEAITWVRQTSRSRRFGWLCLTVLLILLVVGLPTTVVLLLLAVALVLLGMSAYERCRLWPAAGLAYAALPPIALTAIRDGNGGGLAAMLFLFAVVWATDVCAYFTGRAFGGPKLARRLSPKKTWSGAFGGTIAAIVAGTCVAWIAEGSFGLHIPLLALALSIVAQLGDLGESWVKRAFGVKDSGRVIPGHGGVMDRVDGLVAAASLIYLVVAVLTGLAGGATPLSAM